MTTITSKKNDKMLKIKVINTQLPVFDMGLYFSNINTFIKNTLTRPQHNKATYDLLDTDTIKHNKLIVLKYKQFQMKIGEIWQEIIGQYDTFTNLGRGHNSGLDILSNKRKIIIELKNRTNTDNASARKSNFDKLVRFKKNNMSYTCVYACINADTKEKTIKGESRLITHKDVNIHYMVGYEFLKFIFDINMDKVISFMRKTIEHHLHNVPII